MQREIVHSPISLHAWAGLAIGRSEKCRVAAAGASRSDPIGPLKRPCAARATLGEGNFLEVFCDTPIGVCEQRDPKGLYKKARAGELKGFTGIDDPYEAPLNPELVIDNSKCTPQQAAVTLIKLLEKSGKLSPMEA